MTSDEKEISEVRRQEQAGLSANKREAQEKRRQMGIFMEKARKAKRTNEPRAFEEALRGANVSENSPEWKRAWDYFYDRS
jgi:hypothetical protein